MLTAFLTQLQLSTVQNTTSTFVQAVPHLARQVLGAAIIACGALITLRSIGVYRLAHRHTVVLELTPSANEDKSPLATKELFTALHGLHGARPFLYQLLSWRPVFSCELVATRSAGIRFLVYVAAEDQLQFERTIAAYAPTVKIRQVDDYVPHSMKHTNVQLFRFKQTGHFAYPLKDTSDLKQHDPVSYLTSTMTRLGPQDMVAVQLVLSPVVVPSARKIGNRLLRNDEYLSDLGSGNSTTAVSLSGILSSALFGVLDAIGTIVHGPTRQTRVDPITQRTSAESARTLSAIEQQLAHAVHDKLSQPLFASSIRVMVATGNNHDNRTRIHELRQAVGLYSTPYQSLKGASYPALPARCALRLFRYRLPTFFGMNRMILAAGEVAGLYHFPHTVAANNEDVVRSLSKTLPVPVDVKRHTDHGEFDVVLGRSNHRGTCNDIGLTAAERERHVYIVGGTGNGKTTMLEYAIVQDIRNGKGVAVIDPHGDLAANLLRYIPKNRVQDVIYFNPADLSYPIGLNLLELPEGLEGDELLDAKDFITEAVISVMRKVFSDDDSGGHRIEYVLRNAVQTALTMSDATLFTIFDLLTDSAFRNQVAKKLENKKLKNFWIHEFGRAGDFQRVKMAGGVTAKIGRFQFSASAERILSQPKSTINFEEILDGKLLICNFAKGLIGEDTSELYGVATLAKLQLAAYRRVKTNQKMRKPFYLYVDEFQNFATMSFVQMLSEARKYKLFLTMAEQSTSQQEDVRMVNTILANVGTVIAFRSGSPADERMLLPLFKPYIDEGEIANLPTYHYYARLAAVVPQEPLSGETMIPDSGGSEAVARTCIETSRSKYAHTVPAAKKRTNESRTARRIIHRHTGKKPQA